MRALGLHVQHDASVAVVEDGRLKLVLELERLFGRRYFESSAESDTFSLEWMAARDAVVEFCGEAPFDVAVTSWVMPSRRRLLETIFDARSWRTVDHHRAHALHAVAELGDADALVISFDGGGNDGSFNVFRHEHGAVRHLERVALNLGTPYRLLATTMPEVTGRRAQVRAGSLALSGKLMAYAALGEVRESWVPQLVAYYRHFQSPLQALYSLGEALELELEPDALDDVSARALAASSQRAFEVVLLEEVRRRLGHAERRLVLTGGCALNVVANEVLRRALDVEVIVPPAPNDAGIASGAAWSVSRALETPDVFCGLPLVDDVTATEFTRRGAVKSSTNLVARLLADGAVIGIARGRAEHGPRALGHRSIVALPSDGAVRERINARIKGREWFRPLAPVVLRSRAAELFGTDVSAPYMSFAPRLTTAARARFSAIAHVDGTARVQTVEAGALADLLHALERRGVPPVLVNTSFNLHGRPLLHRASEALEALSTSELDFVEVGALLVPRDGDVARAFQLESGA